MILFTEMARRCFDVSWMYLTVFWAVLHLCVLPRAGSSHCRLQLLRSQCCFAVPQTALEPGIDRVGWSSGGFPGEVYHDFFSSGTNTSVHFRIQDVGSFRTAPVAACMDGGQRSDRCSMHGAGSGFACILYAAFSISTVFKRALWDIPRIAAASGGTLAGKRHCGGRLSCLFSVLASLIQPALFLF